MKAPHADMRVLGHNLNRLVYLLAEMLSAYENPGKRRAAHVIKETKLLGWKVNHPKYADLMAANLPVVTDLVGKINAAAGKFEAERREGLN